VLRHALGGKRCEYVLALLAFIRTAHFWTLVHPAIEMEDDAKQFMDVAIERTRSLVGPLADITRVAGNGRFRGQSGQPENARIADIGMSAACQITHDMEMIARN